MPHATNFLRLKLNEVMVVKDWEISLVEVLEFQQGRKTLSRTRVIRPLLGLFLQPLRIIVLFDGFESLRPPFFLF